MSRSDIQHRQLRLLLQQKSCLCCYCCYYISVVFQNPQAKNSSKNLKWQPAFRLVKVVFVVVNRQHRVHNQTVVPVVSVVVKTKAQKIIDKSERLVETRYCLTGSRMGTTYPRASPPVTTASLSTALQAGRLLSSGWSRRGTALQADPCEWMYVGGWCEGE